VTNALTLRRTRNLPELLSASFAVYGDTRLCLKLLTLSIPGIVFGLSAIALTRTLPDWTSSFPVFVLGFVETAVLGSAAIYALDQAERGEDASIGGSIAQAWKRVEDLLVAAAMSFAIIGALFVTVVGIPFAIIRMVRWSLTSQAIMIDEQEGDASLAYCAGLVAGYSWPTAGKLLAIFVVQYVPGSLVVELLGLAFDRFYLAFLNVALTALLFPFGVTARTLLYYDLKMRKALA
jgi:hypothetical protein